METQRGSKVGGCEGTSEQLKRQQQVRASCLKESSPLKSKFVALFPMLRLKTNSPTLIPTPCPLPPLCPPPPSIRHCFLTDPFLPRPPSFPLFLTCKDRQGKDVGMEAAFMELQRREKPSRPV